MATAKMIDTALLAKIESQEYSAIADLIELGKQKSYVTMDDILTKFPGAEEDIAQLEAAFAALLSVGIPYQDDESPVELSEDEITNEETRNRNSPRRENELADIDPDNAIGLYLEEVGKVPLLTAAEEVELAQQIERGRIAREELASGNVSTGRRLELRRLIEGAWDAREHLIKANTRLVIWVAKKYMNRGMPFQDLIQEGNIGLMRAAGKFDYRRGFKFGTYATWWVRQAVGRAVADQSRTIRLPVHINDWIRKFLRAQHQLTQDLERDPTMEELAKALEISPERVEFLIHVAKYPLSLETPTDYEGDAVLADMIPDQEALAPDEIATLTLLREHLDEVLLSLPPREERILRMRFGLLGERTLTLGEIGREFGITRERVRQIEMQALNRLRHPTIRRKLRAYLLAGN